MKWLWVAGLVTMGLAAGFPVAGQDCSREPLCTEMASCAEADFYLRQCGHVRRDADSDGIPCENLCGDNQATYLERRQSTSLGLRSPIASFACEGKRTCGQMASCDEARHYLNQCGVSSLDRDRDGVPCESICR